MSREHASKGYKVITGTSPVTVSFYGLTALEETAITLIAPPTGPGPENTAYAGDDGAEGGIVDAVIPAGLYLPIRGSAITLTSGKLISWLE